MKIEDKTIIRLIMNRENAELGLGMRIRFHDKYYYYSEEMKLGSLVRVNKYTLRLEPDEFDCWAIFSGEVDADGPWMLLNPELSEKIEDLGEL